jgi:hypothetical protein
VREEVGVDVPQEEWFEVKGLAKQLKDHVLGNGKPSLELRIREYVDQQDVHKQNNAKQDLLDLRTDVDKKHMENNAKLDKLADKHDVTQRLVWIGMGIMVTLEAVGLFKR